MTESPRLLELQQKFEDNPRRYFASLANEYRKAGDLQRAMSICRIYLEKQPEHMAGHVVLGQALHANGNVEEAAEIFKIVLQLDPENLIALKCLGDIAERHGNLQQAHENFRRVLTADPRDHDINKRLRAVEQELKLAASKNEEWIPPRTSGEFNIPDEEPASPAPVPTPPEEAAPVTSEPATVEDPAANVESFSEVLTSSREIAAAAPDNEPRQTLGMDDLPTIEAPAAHEEISQEDFGTLLPEPPATHHPTIAEPVELESAEESLPVPDLMEEAGEAAPAAPAFDDFQFRTAEFRLPATDARPLESSETSTEVESEAAALMEDVEIPPPPPAPEDSHIDQPMRTGEYSLSYNTGEWNRASHDAAASAHESDADEVAAVEPAGPFITETVAELYLQQGFTGEALLVYRQLARAKPGDQRIADRIATLEGRLADEHAARQAALDIVKPEHAAEQPVVEEKHHPEPDITPPPAPVVEKQSRVDAEEFDRAWGGPQVSVPADDDDWFAVPDIAPVRSRQSVHEFFAVLGRAKPEVRKAARARVSAEDIRAAADITAGFGAFGAQPQRTANSIPERTSIESDAQEDVRRFRTWLDGLSDS